MDTYSKSTSDFQERNFEVHSDVNECNNDTKHPVVKPKVHLRKGTAATRLAARKKSAAEKLQAKKQARQ